MRVEFGSVRVDRISLLRGQVHVSYVAPDGTARAGGWLKPGQSMKLTRDVAMPEERRLRRV